MWRLRLRPKAHSLAAVQTGESFTVARLLGDPTRELCHGLGVHEGDTLLCREAARFHLWLQTSDGVVVGIERDDARYVEVLPVTEHPAAGSSGATRA